MGIFDNPQEAANWLRKCEADQLRADTKRYEENIPEEESECGDCGEIFPESELEESICPICVKNRDQPHGPDEPYAFEPRYMRMVIPIRRMK